MNNFSFTTQQRDHRYRRDEIPQRYPPAHRPPPSRHFQHYENYSPNDRLKRPTNASRGPVRVRLVNGLEQDLDASLHEALNSDKRDALLQLEITTQQFLEDSKLFRLAFPDVLNNYFRMLLHHVGDFYNLDHPIDTHQTGKKAITFYKKREFRNYERYPTRQYSLRDVRVDYIGSMCPNPLQNVQFRDTESRQTGGLSRQLYLPDARMYEDYQRRTRRPDFVEPVHSFSTQAQHSDSLLPLGEAANAPKPPRILLNKERFRNSNKPSETNSADDPPQTHEERVQNYNLVKDKIFGDGTGDRSSGGSSDAEPRPSRHTSHLLREFEEKLKNQQNGDQPEEIDSGRPRVDNPADYRRDKMHYRPKTGPNMKYNKRTSDALVQHTIAQKSFDTPDPSTYVGGFNPQQMPMHNNTMAFPMQGGPRPFMFAGPPQMPHAPFQQHVPQPQHLHQHQHQHQHQRPPPAPSGVNLPPQMMPPPMHMRMTPSMGIGNSMQLPSPLQQVPVHSQTNFMYYPPQHGRASQLPSALPGHVGGHSMSSNVQWNSTGGTFGSTMPLPRNRASPERYSREAMPNMNGMIEPFEIPNGFQHRPENKLDFASMGMQPQPLPQAMAPEMRQAKPFLNDETPVFHPEAQVTLRHEGLVEHPPENNNGGITPTRRRPPMFSKERRNPSTGSDDSSSRGSVDNEKRVEHSSDAKSTPLVHPRKNGPTRPPMIVKRTPPVEFSSITTLESLSRGDPFANEPDTAAPPSDVIQDNAGDADGDGDVNGTRKRRRRKKPKARQ